MQCNSSEQFNTNTLEILSGGLYMPTKNFPCWAVYTSQPLKLSMGMNTSPLRVSHYGEYLLLGILGLQLWVVIATAQGVVANKDFSSQVKSHKGHNLARLGHCNAVLGCHNSLGNGDNLPQAHPQKSLFKALHMVKHVRKHNSTNDNKTTRCSNKT